MKQNILPIGILFFGAALSGLAQAPNSQKSSLTCDHKDRNGRLISHCEMREQTIASGGRLTIDGRANGGITVKGWARNEILIRAQVRTAAPTEAEASLLASQVFLQTAAGRIAATGPVA